MKKTSFAKVLLALCLSLTCLGCSFAEAVPGETPATAASASITPACTITPTLEYFETATPPPATATATEQQITYGAWVPYWDYAAAIDEVDQLGQNLDSVVCFAAIFNAQDKLFLLPEMQEALACLNILYSSKHTIYLSVVNDIELEEEVYDNKSADLLWRLLGTDTAIDTHIENLMAMLHQTGSTGLEIDYEAIQSDVALWQRFALFVGLLYERTQAEGYPLRVILSWDSARYAIFPEGPQYSIMCYNLYGSHSGPGPKADSSFLHDVFSINRALPGRPALAFATGGFDWGDDGSVVSLTQSDAVDIRKTNGISPESIYRDEESAVLNFSYYDEDALRHEVWYADGETLAYWRSLALDAGYTAFDLFRLGGNVSGDLAEFFELTSVSLVG